MGTHLRVLSESYPMITNMTKLDGFQGTTTLIEKSLDFLGKHVIFPRNP